MIALLNMGFVLVGKVYINYEYDIEVLLVDGAPHVKTPDGLIKTTIADIEALLLQECV